MSVVQDTHDRRQCCFEEISLVPMSDSYDYARGAIMLQFDSYIILASRQVSLKWPACRGHLTVLRGTAGCWDGL